MLRPARGLLATTLAMLLTLALCSTAHARSTPASGRSTPASSRSTLVAFLAPTPARSAAKESDEFERELASLPQLSTGLLSATQGAYTTAQMILDMTQGARVSPSAYDTASPPSLRLTGDRAQPWASIVRRAQSAPQLLEPGLLASQIPGGAAYVRAAGVEPVDGALAADRDGHVAQVGTAGGRASDALGMLARRRLVVADLPTGQAGYAELRTLVSEREPGELLVVVQRVPGHNGTPAPGHANRELLWVAFAGLGAGRVEGDRAIGGRTITSQSTNERGMVAAIDIAPTILLHLGLPLPVDMRGKPVTLDGPFRGAELRALKSRLAVISGRRLPALGWLLLAWALLLAAARLSALRRREAWSLRVGALALLWTPVGVLATAAIEPSRAGEFGLLVVICFALGTLSDRLLGWPRAPIAPAIAAVVAIGADALAGTQLLMRSLFGPNPEFGARFYGIGNELKSGLAVLVLCAVAAALYPAVRGRRAALAMALAGIVLALLEGSARIGAGVGAVILVSAGAAVATAMLLPGALSRRRALLVMAAPALGLVALAALDLATAHGSGHFTGSVLHARSAGDLRDIIVRRYGAAWDELRNHLMPLATALALGAGTLIVARRERACAPVGADPAWMAALCGGFAAGLIGALTEDSGPVLLVVAVGALGCVLAYLWGRPPADRPRAPEIESHYREEAACMRST